MFYQAGKSDRLAPGRRYPVKLPNMEGTKAQLVRKSRLHFFVRREGVLPLSKKISPSIDNMSANGATARLQVCGKIRLAVCNHVFVCTDGWTRAINSAPAKKSSAL